MERIREGIGEKIGVSVDCVGNLISGMLISFSASWQLALVMLAFAPLLVSSGAIWAKVR